VQGTCAGLALSAVEAGQHQGQHTIDMVLSLLILFLLLLPLLLSLLCVVYTTTCRQLQEVLSDSHGVLKAGKQVSPRRALAGRLQVLLTAVPGCFTFVTLFTHSLLAMTSRHSLACARFEADGSRAGAGIGDHTVTGTSTVRPSTLNGKSLPSFRSCGHLKLGSAFCKVTTFE
jgi:hypothetical protein